MDFTKLTAYLDSLEENYGIPETDVIVTKGQEVVYRHLTGFADAEKTRPAGEKDCYWFYSCTKVITNTAILQLLEQGKIHLYDPVYKYLPEFEYMTVVDEEHMDLPFGEDGMTPGEPVHYAKNQIRIIDLMSMMAGLTYNLRTEAIGKVIQETKGTASTREVVKAIAEGPLAYEPGTRFKYSLAHDVLAAVIEVVSGERYSRYLKHHIFDVLGADTLCFLPGEEELKYLAQLYKDTEEGLKPESRGGFGVTTQYESGGGGLYGSTEAYSKIMQALANGGIGANGGRILMEKTVKLFTAGVTTGIALQDFERMEKGPYSYGLGVRVKNTDKIGRSPIGEFGWDGAAGAYALVDMKNQVSITYLQHILNFPIVYTEIHPEIRDLAYEAMGL